MDESIALKVFIRKWLNQLPTDKRAEALEDLRRVVVTAQQSFRNCQVRGEFVDGTGDAFLQNCQKSFEKPAPLPRSGALNELRGAVRRAKLFPQIDFANTPDFIRYTTYVEIALGNGFAYWLNFSTPEEVVADFLALRRLLQMEEEEANGAQF